MKRTLFFRKIDYIFHKYRADSQSFMRNATDDVLADLHKQMTEKKLSITFIFAYSVISAHLKGIQDFVFLYPSFFEELRDKSDDLIFQFSSLKKFDTIEHALKIALAILEFACKYQLDPNFKTPKIIILLNHTLSLAQQNQLTDASHDISRITVEITANNFSFTNANNVALSTNETTRLMS